MDARRVARGRTENRGSRPNGADRPPLHGLGRTLGWVVGLKLLAILLLLLLGRRMAVPVGAARHPAAACRNELMGG